MTWPLEPVAWRRPRRPRPVLVIEEKRGLIESQAKELFYHLPQAARVIIGKRDEPGAPLLPSHGELSLEPGGDRHRRAAAGRGVTTRRCARASTSCGGPSRRAPALRAGLARLPYFCPGCPHNSSTHVPEG